MSKKSAPSTPEELRAKKERKRARLQALLPLLSPEKAQDAREELVLLDARLGKQQPAFAKKPKDDPASASGVNGVGGLVFQAKSPPGAGRLLRVPFVLYEANAAQLSFQAPQVGPMFYTAAGPNQVSSTNPSVTVTMPNDASGRRVLSGFLFRTNVIEWAKLRIVGLEVCQRHGVYGGNAVGAVAGISSPLPGSAVNVNLYDVGPGTGATGRYDSFQLVPAPATPAPIAPQSLPIPPGGVAAAEWLNPLFSTTPSALNFGVVAVNSTTTLTFAMAETAGEPRTFTAKASGDPAFTDNVVVATSVVPANGSLTVTVSFTPTSTGLFSTTLTFDMLYDPPGPPISQARITIPVIGAAVENNYYKNGRLYLLVKGLNVGGGANLLSQEGYIDASIYDSRLSEFPGLRAYPELVSPNQAFIEAAIVGPQLATMTFSLNLLCEDLEDEDVGVPTPGPYARRDALMRSDVDTPNSKVR